MSKNPVIDYYHSFESRLGYRLLQGVKHFGYYPSGQETLSKYEAQMLMNEQLAQKLHLPVGSRVLDAGSGEGNVALYLAEKHGLSVDGIDLLDFNVKNAKANATKKQQQHVSFQVGSYMHVPFADNSFDAVYTMETLVHAPDYRQALAEFHRVLKPGGKLVCFEYTMKPEADITTPQEVEGMRRIKQINRVAAMPAFDEFTFGSIEAKLAAAGFTESRVTDITPRILPMLHRFYKKAHLIYSVLRLLHLENHVINSMSAVEFYKHQSLWRYEIFEARR
jgi:sterol 24-C-methyltransferase